MNKKIIEHICAMVFVTMIVCIIVAVISVGDSAKSKTAATQLDRLGNLDFVDFSDAFSKAVVKDAANVFYPGEYDSISTFIERISTSKANALDEKLMSTSVKQRLDGPMIATLAGMYAKFLLIYIIVLLLTYYGVQTIASWRFCREHRTNFQITNSNNAGRITKNILLGIASFVLFSPAYVIAYSIRSGMNTDSVPFMIFLGVISNGLLMVYANKFYTFLVAEYHKGYVDTARVKRLSDSYEPKAANGISYRSLLRPKKHFPGHLFGQIYKNAAIQYLATVKEQAMFLISGLIIIEMALNIHGHLCYELLRQMLYKNFDIVAVIILLIFYTVKLTDIGVDILSKKAWGKYEN